MYLQEFVSSRCGEHAERVGARSGQDVTFDMFGCTLRGSSGLVCRRLGYQRSFVQCDVKDL